MRCTAMEKETNFEEYKTNLELFDISVSILKTIQNKNILSKKEFKNAVTKLAKTYKVEGSVFYKSIT